MMNSRRRLLAGSAFLGIVLGLGIVAVAQNSAIILTGTELNRIMPPGFYFQGLSAPTQMRNSAAVRLGDKRFVLAGLVDTTGYSSDIKAKYEGFFITDSPIKVQGSDLAPGAYGFGFSADGKLTLLDLTAKEVLSVSATKDNDLKRPRPLMMTKSSEGIRFYTGKDYVVISPN
jgi:hypothetical protein